MKKVAKVFSLGLFTITVVVVILTSFLTGYIKGYTFGWSAAQEELASGSASSTTNPSPTPTPKAVVVPSTKPKAAPVLTLSGPALWEAVNKRRVELGVNPLKQKDELCTIASIRLNQLLNLGQLDGHEGFSKLPTERPDLKWIFDTYNISEFLVSGAASPQEAVGLWENSLGHRKLLSGGEYSWGCIYAQSGFGVAIAAY